MSLPNYERPAFAGSNWKPVKGEAALKRKASAAKVRSDEKAVKAEVTKRDGQKVCRLDPDCKHVRVGITVEGVHLDDKGMGGDHGVRTTRDRMLRGCAIHHRGAKSLHSGDLKVHYLTDKGTDGPIALMRPNVSIELNDRLKKTEWVEFARERAIGVWMTAKEMAR
jgi:L-ascorbate metabolism protein UlaG (beta-lactamase superfamily)